VRKRFHITFHNITFKAMARREERWPLTVGSF
jgi:hypothetical protein